MSTCTKRCQYYMQETMNFNKKGYCDVAHNATGTTVNTKINHQRWQQRRWFNNKAECTGNGFTWYEVSHSDNLVLSNNSFVCAHTQYSRTNQLGNARGDLVVSQNEYESSDIVKSAVNEGLNANRFLWTIPDIPTARDENSYFTAGMTAAYKSCTLRMRYNISSADFQQWPEGAVDNGTERMVDYLNNSRSLTDTRTPLRQDPYVYIGPGDRYKTQHIFLIENVIVILFLCVVSQH